MANSSIEWTEKTWNPVTGCDKVSQGCKNCYAEGIADRFFAKQYPPNADGSLRKFTDVRCHEDRLNQPLHWRKPSRVFVNSMSDLFHEDVPMAFLNSVFNVMRDSPQHTFQVLTKRPIRMLAYMSQREVIPPNVWAGVSVEDQKTADERISLLLQTSAAVRWVSYEPALGPVSFRWMAVFGEPYASQRKDGNITDHLDGLRLLDWIVCGGESGPCARPFNIQWARDVRDQCKAAGVPFFMKQLGSNPVGYAVAERKGGNMEQWPEDIRIREYPQTLVSA